MSLIFRKAERKDVIVNLYSFYLKTFKNIYISGGSPRSYFTAKKPKDIDIFFKDEESFKDAVRIANNDKSTFEFIFENGNCVSFLNKKTKIRVEFIKFAFFKSPLDLYLYFDFTISTFMIFNQKDFKPDELETDLSKDLCFPVDREEVGRQFFDFIDQTKYSFYEAYVERSDDAIILAHDDKYFEHIHQKKLVTHKRNVLAPSNAFKLSERYASYGFKPCAATRRKLILGIYAEGKGEYEYIHNLFENHIVRCTTYNQVITTDTLALLDESDEPNVVTDGDISTLELYDFDPLLQPIGDDPEYKPVRNKDGK